MVPQGLAGIRKASYAAITACLAILVCTTFTCVYLLTHRDGTHSGSHRVAKLSKRLLAAGDGNASGTFDLYSQEVTYFPECNFNHQPDAIEDFTFVLKQHPQLADFCIHNPSIAMVDDEGHMLVSYRMYRSWDGTPCGNPDEPGGQWKDGWGGQGGLGLAVVKRTAPGDMQVVVQHHEIGSSREDARLFRDDKGKIRLLYNRYRGGDPTMRGFKMNQRRSMHTVEVVIAEDLGSIDLVNEQELIYINQQRDEKNWVPWEGSTLMTYPQFPEFQPHIVIEWNNYEAPEDQLEFKSVQPVDFMEKFRQFTGRWIRFSGGTPGVKLDADSHAFIPWDAHEHRGVYFPSGLGWLPAVQPAVHQDQPPEDPGGGTTRQHNRDRSLYLTYGQDDNKLMGMTFSPQLLKEWLMPIDRVAAEDYSFCTIAKGSPVYTAS